MRRRLPETHLRRRSVGPVSSSKAWLLSGREKKGEAERRETKGGGPVATYHEEHARTGLRSWSRTRWLLVSVVLIAIVIGVVLIVTYTGGGGSSGPGGGGY